LLLGKPQSGFNIFNTLFGKGIVPTFSNEGDLIFRSFMRLLTGVADNISTLVLRLSG
jgi:hypothetical protein